MRTAKKITKAIKVSKCSTQFDIATNLIDWWVQSFVCSLEDAEKSERDQRAVAAVEEANDACDSGDLDSLIATALDFARSPLCADCLAREVVEILASEPKGGNHSDLYRRATNFILNCAVVSGCVSEGAELSPKTGCLAAVGGVALWREPQGPLS